MFGLMKASTHKEYVADILDENADLVFRNENQANTIRSGKTRNATLEAELVTLKGQLETMTLDRDNWKQSESDCNAQYDKVKAENVTLKARIAELEKPVPLPKRKPVVKASPVKETVKVPVKGKVEAKSGKVLQLDA